jgi:hypothetical protein
VLWSVLWPLWQRICWKILLRASPVIIARSAISMLSPSCCWVHMHSLENIIHHEISARNILLSSNLDIKICDFGSAGLLGEDTHGLAEFRYSFGRLSLDWEKLCSSSSRRAVGHVSPQSSNLKTCLSPNIVPSTNIPNMRRRSNIPPPNHLSAARPHSVLIPAASRSRRNPTPSASNPTIAKTHGTDFKEGGGEFTSK